MGEHEEKSREELIHEIQQLQAKADSAELLHQRLKKAEADLFFFKQSCEERNRALALECEEHEKVSDELRMAKLIVERSPVILFRRSAGEDAQLQYISENIQQFGYSPQDFFDNTLTFGDIVHPDDRERVEKELIALAEANIEEYSQRYRCITRSGEIRWVEDKTSVVRDENGNKTHHQGVLYDITARTLATRELKKSEEKHRRIVETAAEGFVLVDDEQTIIDVNQAYCNLFGYSRQELIGKNTADLASKDFRDFLEHNRGTLMKQEFRVIEGAGARKDGSSVPILIHGNVLRDDQGKMIGNMAFVTDMTEHKKALMLAGEVQKSLLPQEKPVVNGLDVAGRNVSCDEIGGDYYDFIWHPGSGRDPFSVVVGDISGHGVDSALLMTTARAFLRMRASQPGTISEIVSAMNSHLAKDVLESGRFMTLFYLCIDRGKRQIDWVRAGHDPAILYDTEKDRFEELKGNGIALGVMDDISYEEHHRLGLENGQIIAVGTDGIWESFNTKGEMFGRERLKAILKDNAHRSASEILNTVYDEVARFSLGVKTEDDITLVIIKVEGLAGS